MRTQITRVEAADLPDALDGQSRPETTSDEREDGNLGTARREAEHPTECSVSPRTALQVGEEVECADGYRLGVTRSLTPSVRSMRPINDLVGGCPGMGGGSPESRGWGLPSSVNPTPPQP